ncbi:MAG: TonB-dependent receptor [Williamsia sp.]|nr:TonB-dependent receptor [Williamsia sp.]
MRKIYSYLLLVSFTAADCAAQTAAEKKDTVSRTELPGIVVSASRQRETILQSPVSIEKLEPRQIKQAAQPSFFDAIENVKGIQMITPSLGFKVINARGFTNTTNVRFVQMVDGIDIQAPHIGAPIANALGPSDLDISNVEIIPGSSSALYGMNAINGTANFITLDPFLHQGLSIQQKTGVNNVNSPERSATLFSETALRLAKAYKRFAFKINATYTGGTDWYANNLTDLNPGANVSTGLAGAQNPGSDLVNNYADESSNRRTLTLGGKQYVVSRTGYREKDMASYNLKNYKADLLLAYQLGHAAVSYGYRIAQTNTIYQRTNRFRLDNYLTQQHSFTLKSPSIQFRAYVNVENTGDSYNIRSMAENVDRSFKTDDAWFRDFSSQYNRDLATGSSVPDAMKDSRTFADKGRPQPHTPQADSLIARLRDINDWNLGAALRVRTTMYHAEMQHDLTESILKWLRTKYNASLMYGVDFRDYVVIPDGNYFINPVKSGSNLTYYKFGGFVQLNKYLFARKVRINAVLRADKNQYFSAKLNPRISLVYSPKEGHNFRLAVQEGYRFPSLFEAFSNINSGGVKRVGGLNVMSNGIFENSYLRASIDAFRAANTNDVNRNGLTVQQAIQKNKGLLKRNTYTYLQPERVRGAEAGYRGNILDNKVSIDIDFYYNIYHNLMAQVEANIPRTNVPDSLAYYLNDLAKQDRYRLWTNSKTVSYNYGSTLGLTWHLPKSFVLSGNATLAKLDRTDQKDGLEDGFNTPRWIYNLSFGNPSVMSHVGFQLNYRHQVSYLWQSSLATGNVPAYSTLDAQVQYSAPKNWLGIKLGATNLLNKYYYSFIGGPSIGGFYYCTTTVNLF